jgi:hypothetical protein
MRKAYVQGSCAVPALTSPFRQVIVAALTRTPSDWIRGNSIARWRHGGRSLGREAIAGVKTDVLGKAIARPPLLSAVVLLAPG